MWITITRCVTDAGDDQPDYENIIEGECDFLSLSVCDSYYPAKSNIYSLFSNTLSQHHSASHRKRGSYVHVSWLSCAWIKRQRTMSWQHVLYVWTVLQSCASNCCIWQWTNHKPYSWWASFCFQNKCISLTEKNKNKTYFLPSPQMVNYFFVFVCSMPSISWSLCKYLPNVTNTRGYVSKREKKKAVILLDHKFIRTKFAVVTKQMRNTM